MLPVSGLVNGKNWSWQYNNCSTRVRAAGIRDTHHFSSAADFNFSANQGLTKDRQDLKRREKKKTEKKKGGKTGSSSKAGYSEVFPTPNLPRWELKQYEMIN
jgi:hypothetical protein